VPEAAKRLGLDPAIGTNYAILLCLPRKYDDWGLNPAALSRDKSGDPELVGTVCRDGKASSNDNGGSGRKAEAIRTYLYAGFDLADEYCELYFEDADESQRRRKYGRALWNDFGTAISTILGLANAGEDIVTGAAAGFGLGDSAWRNYDDAFVVGPDLSAVQSLVFVEQQLIRTNLASGRLEAPQSFFEAKSHIRHYARPCTYLGMRSLLNRAAAQSEKGTHEEIERTLATEKAPADAQADQQGQVESAAEDAGDGGSADG